ncbi:alkaline phosphatase [Paenibacillus sp. P26]|nr:alkaline phosphatase [Paenibacillus sp. P26]
MNKNFKVLSSAVLAAAIAFATVNSPSVSAADAPSSQQGAASITILPIDRATILAGQKLDFRVELNNGAANKDDIKVSINGVDAEQFFGKKAERTNASANSAEFTIRDVNFDKAGIYTVKADIAAGGQTLTKSVNYEVFEAVGNSKNAKNVILMIGDGMSANIRTAARVVSKGIEEGKFKGWLEMEKMDHMGMITTSGMDSIVTDSANSASAYATGHKTAVNAEGVYPDNTADPLDDPRVENIVELVKRTKGMATGIVTTADVTDATPAAMATHTRKRSTSEAITNMFFESGSRPDVLMGGGLEWFLPKDQGGKRTDGKSMIDSFKTAGYSYVTNKTELSANQSDKILGLFRPGNMNVYFDREYTKPNNPDIVGKYTDQPTLMDMTAKAIDALDNNKNGFFLMVEGASIDKMAHPMDFERTIWDTIEFDKTVGLAKQYAQEHKDTLVIVTADHGHSMTLNGTYDTVAAAGKTGEELREIVGTYANSKFPTYTDADGDGFPDNPDSQWKIVAGWGNHPDYNEDYLTNPKPVNPTIQDPNVKDKAWYIANPDKDPNGIHFNGNLPHEESTEVHTFDDVPVNASGPGAELFSGYLDNTKVFKNMVTALGIKAVPAGKLKASKNGVNAVNGSDKMNVASLVKNGVTYAEVGGLAVAVGAKAESKDNQATLTKDQTTVIVKADSNVIRVNGQSVSLDQPVIVNDGKLYAPLRPVAAAFGYWVDWSNE